jgi:hypothetical protein
LADVRRPSLLFGVLRRRRRGSAVSKASCRTALGHSSRAISPGSSGSRLGTVAPAELVIVAISHRRIERGPLQLGLMLAIRIAAVKLTNRASRIGDGHSAGASRSRVTPMPRGSRPSMAAFTSAARGTRRPIRASILPTAEGARSLAFLPPRRSKFLRRWLFRATRRGLPAN